MNLDHQAVCPCCNCGPGHGTDLFPDSGGMARVYNYRQVCQVLDHGDGRKVKGVSCVGLKCPDSPLAQDNIVISL